MFFSPHLIPALPDPFGIDTMYVVVVYNDCLSDMVWSDISIFFVISGIFFVIGYFFSVQRIFFARDDFF